MGSLAENITRAYGGDWHGTYGAFPAPDHSKDDRGVTVRDADTGNDVVFHSFNGADWRNLKDECRRRGLLPERETPGADNGGWRVTGIYEYRGYRTVRKEKPGARKRFVAQRPDGRGGWSNGLGDVERVLYRQDEVDRAAPNATVYLTEGERKADKLVSWGLIATAVAFGARGWNASYAAPLSRLRVVVLVDNDEEGRGFGKRACHDIAAAGGHAVIVELPGLPPSGDIMDWIGDAAQLDALAEAALTAAVPTPAIFPLADLDAWSRTTAKPTPFYMTGHIPEREVTLLTGAGGGNKSTFGQQLATCSAIGRPMLGIDVQRGSAVYLTAEDGDDRLFWNQEHICAALGVSMESLIGQLHLASVRGRLNNELATFDADGRLQPRETFHTLRATLEATKARLLVLDNVAHLFSGNENDRGQVTAFINLLHQLCRDLGVTIVLIAHRNKTGDTYSGSTAWLNAVRSQLVIERPEDGRDPDARVLTIGKANYARPDQQLSFRWHDFALIRDDDLPPDERASMAAAMNAAAEDDAFLACLAKATAEKRNTSPSTNAPNYAPRIFARMPSAGGVTTEGLERAMERLLDRGEIANGQPIYQRDNRQWVTGLGCTKVCTNRAPNPAPSVHRGAPPSSTEVHVHDPLDTTYLSGAAPEGPPAPDTMNDRGPGGGTDAIRVVLERINPTDPFAPGDDE